MLSSKDSCGERNGLAEALVEIAVQLSLAASEMADVAGESKEPAFIQAKSQVERLRDECERLKNELAHHRLKHGC